MYPAPLSVEAEAFLKSLSPRWQSTQAKAIAQAIKGDGHLLRLMRSLRQRDAQLPPSSEHVRVESTTVAGLDAAVYTPRTVEPKGTILYLHGGGWVIGSILTCAQVCCELARETRLRVIAVDYALAPEEPFPKPLYDSIAVAKELRRLYPGALIVAGDSAGGNLALGVEQELPVDALLLYYPVTEARADHRSSWETYAKGYALDAALMELFNEAYAPGVCAEDRRVSPLLMEPFVAPKCPVLLVGAECDILADQGRFYAERVAQFGRKIHYHCIKGAVHLFMTMEGQPMARSVALQETVRFLQGQEVVI